MPLSKKEKASKIGLRFSIRKTENTMKTVCKKNKSYKCTLKTSLNGAVYLTAILEFLASEIIKAGGNKTMNDKRKTILISDIIGGIQNDAELNSYIFGVNTQSSKSSNFMSSTCHLCPSGVSKVPSDLEKPIKDIQKEISHENFYNLDKKRIITDVSLRKVIKSIYPKSYIKKNTFEYLVVLIQNIADSISNLAMYLTQYLPKEKKIIDHRDIHNAMRISMPGKLAKKCLSVGTRANTIFSSY